MELDHVTAIVDDLERVSAMLEALLGITPVGEAEVAGMRIRTFRIGGVEVHVNQPIEHGAPRAHLEAHGPSFHHVAFRCRDLDETLATLTERGLTTAGEPVETAPGLTEVFLSPSATGGLPIQLVQRRTREPSELALGSDAVRALAESVSSGIEGSSAHTARSVSSTKGGQR